MAEGDPIDLTSTPVQPELVTYPPGSAIPVDTQGQPIPPPQEEPQKEEEVHEPIPETEPEEEEEEEKETEEEEEEKTKPPPKSKAPIKKKVVSKPEPKSKQKRGEFKMPSYPFTGKAKKPRKPSAHVRAPRVKKVGTKKSYGGSHRSTRRSMAHHAFKGGY
jgi:hypothetical protein